jgi:hypothetical protein
MHAVHVHTSINRYYDSNRIQSWPSGGATSIHLHACSGLLKFAVRSAYVDARIHSLTVTLGTDYEEEEEGASNIRDHTRTIWL